MPSSVFSAVEMVPRDPILGVTEAFHADSNPSKVNLGVGVYNDDTGKLPLLECVKRVERELTNKSAPHGYLPIDGLQAYDKAAQALVFGADSEPLRTGRIVTIQAIGGTGALKIAADFLRRGGRGPGAGSASIRLAGLLLAGSSLFAVWHGLGAAINAICAVAA